MFRTMTRVLAATILSVSVLAGLVPSSALAACGPHSASVTYYDSVYSGYASTSITWTSGRVVATNRLQHIDSVHSIGNVNTGATIFPNNGYDYAVVLNGTDMVRYVSVPRSGTTIVLQTGRWSTNTRAYCKVP